MRSRVVLSGARLAIAGVTSLVLLQACSDQLPTDVSDSINLAKPGSGPDPIVEGAVPSEAPQNTTLVVRVLGKNFDDGSKVRFLLNGKPTKNIGTNSTRFVNEGELEANITIALDAATVDYDIEVTTSKKRRGIGTELFNVKSGKPGGANVMGTLGLASGMTATDFDVFIVHDRDTKLAVNNTDLMHVIRMDFKKADGSAYEVTDCVSQDDTTLDDEVLRGLVGELSGPTASNERSTIFIAIDKSTGLTVEGPPITANHLLLVERDGTFDGDAGTTGIKVGRKAHSNELTVEWISHDENLGQDVFEFSGTSVGVVASDPNGRGGKFGRAIACDGGEGANKVVVTLHR